MIVNFEFMCDESIENLITEIHFEVDKMVYFGYFDVIQNRRKAIDY